MDNFSLRGVMTILYKCGMLLLANCFSAIRVIRRMCWQLCGRPMDGFSLRGVMTILYKCGMPLRANSSSAMRVTPNMVNAVAWSPDGRFLASGSGGSRSTHDHTVQVWDATSGRQLLRYEGHSHSIRTVAWSLNGLLLASAGNDNTV